jgi:hypothetical protein
MVLWNFLGATVAALSRHREKRFPGNRLTVGVETLRCSLDTVLLKLLPLPGQLPTPDESEMTWRTLFRVCTTRFVQEPLRRQPLLACCRGG